MQNITVLGAGTLGSQIAFHAAYSGKHVVIYDTNIDVLNALTQRWRYLWSLYLRDLDVTATLDEVTGRIEVTNILEDALEDADLVIESVSEILEVKRELWSQAGTLAPEHAILTTNSSTLLPSQMADATRAPSRFLALHFANEIWRMNIAEIMGHEHTAPEHVDTVKGFAQDIGMHPVVIEKEQRGYVLNSLLVPFLQSAAKMYVNDVASIEDIDATWRISTGAPFGPFQMYDVIGMQMPYYLNAQSKDDDMRRFAEIVKRDFIEKGRMGKASGKGFYDYE